MFNVHEITRSQITWSLRKKAVVRKLEEWVEEEAGWTLPTGLRPAQPASLSLRKTYTQLISVRGNLTLGMEPNLGKREIKLYGRH